MPSGGLLTGRTGELTQMQRAILDDGFLVVPGVFKDRELASLINEFPDPVDWHGRAGIRHVLTDPVVWALANDPRLLILARDVLGDSAFAFRATFFDKSQQSNWLIAWHQDTALPVAERKEAEGWGSWSLKDGVLYAHAPARVLDQVVALRVHLDRSTAENGPLRVLPGSHRAGILSDDEIEESVRTGSTVTCTVDSGGILVMRPLLLHASSKSLGPLRRRVLHIEYAATSTFSDGICLAAPINWDRVQSTPSSQSSMKRS